jgi:hypothetical protein
LGGVTSYAIRLDGTDRFWVLSKLGRETFAPGATKEGFNVRGTDLRLLTRIGVLVLEVRSGRSSRWAI